MCAVVIKHLSFPWCFSHSSVSSDMLTQSMNPKMPANEKTILFFSFICLYLVIHSYVYMSKYNIKTHSNAQNVLSWKGP